jgi:hypothetical protein
MTVTEQPAVLTLLAKFVESATDMESPSGYISTMGSRNQS